MKEIITDFENLYHAYRKVMRGKKNSQGAARFSNVALDGVYQLKTQLEDCSYQIGAYHEFKIYEPKERIIKSCSFKDKVVQHCLCDNVLLPRLSQIFITDNYAGQIGKGTNFAMDRLKLHMLEHFREHRLDGWILKCDVKKFFYTIDHEILKDTVDYYFPDDYTQWINHLYIDSTPSPGLPLGNQAAQVYALLILHCIDTLATGELGVCYGRYMDDFFLIHHDKVYLETCLEAIRQMTESLNLQLNGKTQIIPFRKGIRFMGFHHYVTKEGRYIRKLSGEKKRRIKRKLRKWSHAVDSGKMPEKKFYEKYQAWRNHALHGNCIKLCRSMDLYVKELRDKDG